MSLALLVGSVNAACVNLRPAPTPLSAAAAGAAPTQVWAVRAGRRLTGGLTLDGETLYGAGVDRRVYAIDLASGTVRWSVRLSGIIAGGVLVSGDTVFAASSRPEGRVYALDRTNGKQLWRTSTGLVGAPLTLVNGLLIAATQKGNVFGLEPRTGQVRWKRKLGVSRVAPMPVDSQSVVVATLDSLFRVDVGSGKVAARAPSPGVVLSSWVPYDSALVAGTTDSLIVAIRPSDLALQWRVLLDAPVLGSPAAKGDTLFAASRRGTLYRIAGMPVPKAERIVALDWPVTAPVSVVGNEILLGGADGAIRAIGVDGREHWRLQLWRPVELKPLPLSDGLIAAGGDGDLHRYRH